MAVSTVSPALLLFIHKSATHLVFTEYLPCGRNWCWEHDGKQERGLWSVACEQEQVA